MSVKSEMISGLPTNGTPNDTTRQATAWAGLWHSRNFTDGVSEHILYANCLPALFKTRKEAREHILKHYGYIRYREDLRQEPHGWRLPRPIRVSIVACPKSNGATTASGKPK